MWKHLGSVTVEQTWQYCCGNLVIYEFNVLLVRSGLGVTLSRTSFYTISIHARNCGMQVQTVLALYVAWKYTVFSEQKGSLWTAKCRVWTQVYISSWSIKCLRFMPEWSFFMLHSVVHVDIWINSMDEWLYIRQFDIYSDTFGNSMEFEKMMVYLGCC